MSIEISGSVGRDGRIDPGGRTLSGGATRTGQKNLQQGRVQPSQLDVDGNQEADRVCLGGTSARVANL